MHLPVHLVPDVTTLTVFITQTLLIHMCNSKTNTYIWEVGKQTVTYRGA